MANTDQTDDLHTYRGYARAETKTPTHRAEYVPRANDAPQPTGRRKA
jgi:hypothetical protein